MKKLKYRWIGLYMAITACLFSACGEDRTYEYEALLANNTWIQETMDNYYLWCDSMPQLVMDNYFGKPTSFFQDLLSKTCRGGKGDTFSYIEKIDSTLHTQTRSLSINKESTYGFDFVLYSDPTKKTTHNFARVLYVLPGSPAAAAGLTRGQWIEKVGNKTLTNDNYGYLQKGTETDMVVTSLKSTITEEGQQVLSWTQMDTLHIGASSYIEEYPFYVDTVYQIDNHRIAYMAYSHFSTGPNDEADETTYGTQMKQIFEQFKSQSADAFILDLRYNMGGYVSMAQKLGSLLAPQTAMGKTFCTLKYNNKHTDENYSFPFDANYAGNANLNLNKIYILTSHYTASASELIINGLIPVMGRENVVLIGTTTKGKNVASKSFTSKEYRLIMHPIVATCYNGNGNSDYEDGFIPDFLVDELQNYNTLLPLGNIQEALLAKAISLITGHADTDNTATPAAQVQMGFNSMNSRCQPAVRIN